MELEPEDYNEILNWFTHRFGKLDTQLPPAATSTIWKITFLVEERIKSLKEEAHSSYILVVRN